MGKKADLIEAAQSIRDAILDFVPEDNTDRIHVYESTPGILRVLVGSAMFKNMRIAERQETVWQYLRKHVEAAHLNHCLGVDPLDLEEYEEQVTRTVSFGAKAYMEARDTEEDSDA